MMSEVSDVRLSMSEADDSDDSIESLTVSSESDDETYENFEWTPYDELILLHSMLGHRPIGINHSFLVVVIWKKFIRSTGKKLPLSVIKKKLKTYYNFDKLSSLFGKFQFPDEEFSLPPEDFPEIYDYKRPSKEDKPKTCTP